MRTGLILVIALLFSCGTQKNHKEEKIMEEPREISCFSEDNFETVYWHIASLTEQNDLDYLPMEDYQLKILDNRDIAIQKEGYTLAKISKEKGIYSLATKYSDNQSIKRKAEELFCKLLKSAK